MKKFVSLFLALALVFSLTISASAAPNATITNLDSESQTEASVTVVVTDGAAAAVRYHIEITWGSLNFQYTKADYNWNPETHEQTPNGEGTWTYKEATISVNNHSNAEVKAKVRFEGGAATATDNNTVVTIAKAASSDELTENEYFVTLQNAQVAAYGEANKAGIEGKTLVKYTVTAEAEDGMVPENNNSFATIVITLQKPN